MANFFDAVGNFFSGVGNAISQGFSNLTGGNSSSSSGSSKPSSPTPSPVPSSPTPSSTSSSGGSTSSGSSGSNRGSSAGAQALSQQITNTASSTASSSSSSSSGSNNGSSGGSKKAQNTPQPSGTTGGSTGGFSESIGNIFDNKSQEVTTSQNTTQNTQNTTNTDAGNSNYNRVVSVVDAIKDNVNDAKNNTEADSGISLGGGSILGNIIENNKPSQTVTDAMRDGNDNSVIVNPQASSLGNIIGGGDSTGSDTQSKKAQNTPEYSTGMENGLTSGGLGVYQDSIGSIFENKQPENIKSSKASSKATSGFGVTPNDVNLGVINAGGLAGVTSGIGNFFESTFGGGNKDTTKTNQKSDGNVQKGVDSIYRDEDLVGVHYFDSRDESEAFLRELYPEGNFDWGEPETGWYDPKTGEYLGYLGEEAYPYAIIVPETYDAPVRLEFNTGGAKGGSPVKDTGKTTWADVPSALTRSELRDAGFDYGFSSRNLDSEELMNQSEMRGYDSSWYDGKIGQNIGLYDASKGGYDARTSDISVADVRAGKVSDDVLSSTPSGQAILDATAQIEKTQPTYYNLSKWQNPNVDWGSEERLPADKHIDNPSPIIPSGGILNNPVELIGTLLGVGAVTKAVGVGGKIGGSMLDNWVSTGGKTMSGFDIIEGGLSSIVGGSSGTVRNVVKQASEFATKNNNQMKLAELGALGFGGAGLFAGKELDSPINVFEIIPKNDGVSEIESSSGTGWLNEITPSSYQSELEVLKESSNPLSSIRADSVFEIERVREREKEREKSKEKDDGFSYADVPTYSHEDKLRFAREAYEKQRQQEIEYEKQKAEEALKEKEQEKLIEKESDFLIVPQEIIKIDEKNKNKVIENHEKTIFNYPMRETNKNRVVHDMVLIHDGLVKNKGLVPFIGGIGDSSSLNLFVDDTPYVPENKTISHGISMGIPRPSPKKDDDDDDDFKLGELTGQPYWGRGRGRSWKVYNYDISDAYQFGGFF